MLGKIKKIIQSRREECKKDNNGFTLLEILIAVTVLSIAITPLVSIFITTAKINSDSRKKIQAVITADSVQEATKGINMYDFWHMVCSQTSGSLDPVFAITGSDYGWVDVSYSLGDDGVTIDLDTVQVTSEIKKDDVITYQESENIYSFLIKGITQGKKQYDAVIIYQKMPEYSVNINGSGYSVNRTFYKDALNKYNIYTMIFDHTNNSFKTGAPIKSEKNNSGSVVLDYITSIQSSKRDSTKQYT